MYLSESKSLRMLTLCGLYVAQGIPWGFVTITFAAWLAGPEQGITARQIGPIIGVATLPWSFKFLWGPLMDRFTIRSLGKRRPWIIFAQSMAILVLGSMIFFDDLAGMVWTADPNDHALLRVMYSAVPGPLAAIILVANVFVSLQDVAVDALAVDLLEEKERGLANGLMYGSSYLGTAIGGAGLGYVVAKFGIQAGLVGQALLLFVIMLLPIFLRERPRDTDEGSRRSLDNEQSETAAATSVDFGETPDVPPVSMAADSPPSTAFRHENEIDRPPPESVFANLIRAFSVRATMLGIAIAVGAKIGIGVITVVLVDYLMKGGGWTQEEYTAIMGGWAVMLGLAGCLVAGFLVDYFGAKPFILTTSAATGLLWIVVGCNPGVFGSHAMITGLLLGQEVLLAMLTVALFSLFMTISWPKVAATQFTAYMALLNLGTTIGSYTAGRLSQSLSLAVIFILAGVLQMIVAIPVLFIDPGETRRILGDGA